MHFNGQTVVVLLLGVQIKSQTMWYVIVRPLITVGYTSVVESVTHSRQWSN